LLQLSERARKSTVTDAHRKEKGTFMLLTIAIILFVLWLLGAFAFHVGGSLIHILLVIAIIVIIWNFIAGRRAV
jgi:fatty acid desaturase